MSRNEHLAAHIPVIHAGYLEMLDRHPGVAVGVMDDSLTSEFDTVRKDVRRLEVGQATAALRGLGREAYRLSLGVFQDIISHESNTVTLPDDEISRALIDKYPPRASVSFEPVFLRWDRKNANAARDVNPENTVTVDNLPFDVVGKLYEEAQRSSDWWRHVGAGVVIDGVLQTTHNRSMPDEHTVNIEGDPRIAANRGVSIEQSLFIHAEADMIAHMAQEGISTKGRDIFVTTFPCPNCARLIAASGFKRCYYVEGYAMLDGDRVLQESGIEVVQIIAEPRPSDPMRLKPYPEK